VRRFNCDTIARSSRRRVAAASLRAGARQENVMRMDHPKVGYWITSAHGSAPDDLPLELAALARQLRACDASSNRRLAWRCRVEAIGRFGTSRLAAALLLAAGLSILLLAPWA
jgi:hypothetical protein